MPENPQAARDNVAARRVGGSSAVDTAAGRILDLIRARQLNVGDVLPTERELSEITGASRNTVREALRTIRTYGLIEPKPRVGAVLADGQSIAIQNFFAAHMDVSRSSFADIQGFRRIIEVGIGDHIVLNATNEQIAALDEVNARIVDSRSIEEAAQNDFNFHRALIGLAGNRTLIDMYSFLSPVILRIMTIGKEMRPVLADTRAAHGEIIAALRARDRLAYAYLMSRHLDFALRFLPEEPVSDSD
ncbi:FCD domain-containing protein [Mesorhizobium sp. M2C.T.Ca.TU.002.02.1.1]|uniref:FadR/GntR family transcriptional regulator n=1 Tax=Mesorhizobium sp. M2C.T.Ca.TU.002.02.1.1 TaxID=2496788 RepID=UPI000FCC8645|nr:FCD domain-containing protein [Mesorhizobium sp. M2C.T.Ca.TU.002.02.1.1]RUU55816.1 FadR family transcriptional regulator [Mesorhizobium sp. M2C.T.Ca.TU.002.02.1.1]RUU69811.1 FadR family transcriptional regulator [Mesorhizobium sp. M2C.T.Ca.TU.009.01.2.1]